MRLTPEQFFSEVAEFRKLMTSKGFWERPIGNREGAIKGLVHALFLTDATEEWTHEKLATVYCATEREFMRREEYAMRRIPNYEPV
jgi:hypothetical protein